MKARIADLAPEDAASRCRCPGLQPLERRCRSDVIAGILAFPDLIVLSHFRSAFLSCGDDRGTGDRAQQRPVADQHQQAVAQPAWARPPCPADRRTQAAMVEMAVQPRIDLDAAISRHDQRPGCGQSAAPVKGFSPETAMHHDAERDQAGKRDALEPGSSGRSADRWRTKTVSRRDRLTNVRSRRS